MSATVAEGATTAEDCAGACACVWCAWDDVLEFAGCCWCCCWAAWAAVLWRTEERALRVLGVTAAVPEPTMARKAAVLGEGGGKATGPPTRGVSPVEGVRPVRNVPEGSKLKESGGAGPPPPFVLPAVFELALALLVE